MADETPYPSRAARQAVTRAELDEFMSRLEDLEAQGKLAASERTETLKLVSSIHSALMEPSPGQNRSLLDRMAAVTINIESGERVTALIVRLAGVLAAAGAILAALKWGGK